MMELKVGDLITRTLLSGDKLPWVTSTEPQILISMQETEDDGTLYGVFGLDGRTYEFLLASGATKLNVIQAYSECVDV